MIISLDSARGFSLKYHKGCASQDAEAASVSFSVSPVYDVLDCHELTTFQIQIETTCLMDIARQVSFAE